MILKEVRKGRFTMEVAPDSDAECPQEYSAWEIHSFSRRHRNFTDPRDVGVLRIDEHGDPVTSPPLTARLKAKTAFLLSYYEHGSCVWFLRGEYRPGVEFQWDGVRTAGVLLLKKKHKLSVDYREQSAKDFLEAYTQWANGEVYSWIVKKDGETLDSLGGLYGFDYALADGMEALDRIRMDACEPAESGKEKP